MTRPTEQQLLAFLDGQLGDAEREIVLHAVENDPELARELRNVAAGMSAASMLPQTATRGPRRVPLWWVAAAAALVLAATVPATLMVNRAMLTGPERAITDLARSATLPEPGFVLVLHGTWPDAASIDQTETQRRAEEYWAWTARLADSSILIAAGDLRWEPGERVAANGAIAVGGDVVRSPDFIVGMYALRVKSYEAAVALSRQCPHLRYGGSVSVRRVARGFSVSPG